MKAPSAKPRQKPKPGTFGNALRAARRLKGLTLKRLADAVPTTACTVCRWELGMKEPTFPQLRRLSEVLGVDSVAMAGWILKPAVQA